MLNTVFTDILSDSHSELSRYFVWCPIAKIFGLIIWRYTVKYLDIMSGCIQWIMSVIFCRESDVE
jgi:hypothetical protein